MLRGHFLILRPSTSRRDNPWFGRCPVSDESTTEPQRVFEASQVLALRYLDGPQAGEMVVLDLTVEERVAPVFQVLYQVKEADLRSVPHAAEHGLSHERPT